VLVALFVVDVKQVSLEEIYGEDDEARYA